MYSSNEMDDATFIARQEFEKRTNKKSLFKQIQNFVDKAKVIRQQSIDEKRKRLEILLKQEQSDYKNEILNNSKARADEDMKKRQDVLIQIRIEREMEEKEFTRKKKIQQYLINCDEIRTSLRENVLKESKSAQLAQIREKCCQQLEEQHQECLWLEVRKRIENQQSEREMYQQKLKCLANLQNKMELEKQMADLEELKREAKQDAEEERRRLDAEMKEGDKREQCLKAVVKNEREKYKKLLKSQREDAARMKQLKQEYEEHFDKVFDQALRIQIAKDKENANQKRAEFKESTLKFLEYCQDLKNFQKQQEAEIEKFTNAYKRDIDEKFYHNSKVAKIKKAEEIKKAHQVLLEQIRRNEHKKLIDCQQNCKEFIEARERHEFYIREDKEIEAKKLLAAKEYAIALIKQSEEMKRFNEEEMKRYNEDLKKAMEEQDYCRDMAEKFIKDNIDYLTPHPNWKLINCPCLNKE